jgi:hypothetical protein
LGPSLYHISGACKINSGVTTAAHGFACGRNHAAWKSFGPDKKKRRLKNPSRAVRKRPNPDAISVDADERKEKGNYGVSEGSITNWVSVGCRFMLMTAGLRIKMVVSYIPSERAVSLVIRVKIRTEAGELFTLTPYKALRKPYRIKPYRIKPYRHRDPRLKLTPYTYFSSFGHGSLVH